MYDPLGTRCPAIRRLVLLLLVLVVTTAACGEEEEVSVYPATPTPRLLYAHLVDDGVEGARFEYSGGAQGQGNLRRKRSPRLLRPAGTPGVQRPGVGAIPETGTNRRHRRRPGLHRNEPCDAGKLTARSNRYEGPPSTVGLRGSSTIAHRNRCPGGPHRPWPCSPSWSNPNGWADRTHPRWTSSTPGRYAGPDTILVQANAVGELAVRQSSQSDATSVPSTRANG